MLTREETLTFVKKSLRFIPDKLYIRLYYRMRLGKKLNIKNPQTFNEKLQWIKFNYRYPLQSIVSDKVLVREYVKDKIGEQYLITLYGKWEKFEDINFDKLPNQFVLKCNHDSGGLIVCTNKEELNYKWAKKIIERSLRSNFYYIGREYQYRNIRPMILCEEFISDNGTIPIDYKIYCYNGEPDMILVCRDRFSNKSHRASYLFFDKEWRFLPLNKGDENLIHIDVECPPNLDEMLIVAQKLSKEFIFARIDLYNVGGRVYFGEITLSPNSGFDNDITADTDRLFGEKFKIPYWDQINTKI